MEVVDDGIPSGGGKRLSNGAGVGGMQMRARQAGKPALRISEDFFFRQVVANSCGHPQDSRRPTEFVAQDVSHHCVGDSKVPVNREKHSEEGKVLACLVRRRFAWLRYQRRRCMNDPQPQV